MCCSHLHGWPERNGRGNRLGLSNGKDSEMPSSRPEKHCRKCRVSDRAEITEDFKAVYTAASKEDATSELESFYTKWNRKYLKIIDALKSNSNMLTFYDFPKEIRSSIYTTNMIESYNKKLKRHFKAKEQFPTELSEEKYLVSQFERYNEKFLNRVHRGFGKVTSFWFNDSYEKSTSSN